MIDTHAHIHDKAFDEDREAMLQRAQAAGVRTLVTVGCDLADSARAQRCAQRYGLFASVGIHPHEAKDAPEDIEAAFAPFLQDERVVAIGETGLDYFYAHSPREAQMECMRAQIRIARHHDYPVIFHHRDAFEDFVSVLESEFAPGMRGVVHCFTGTQDQGQLYVQRFGLKLGIGGVITFKSAQSIRDAIRATGVEHCILETDAPYLAPVPHRGKRNEPSFITQTGAALATLLNLPADEVAQRTDENARLLFGFPAHMA